jgi:hypothetical protein
VRKVVELMMKKNESYLRWKNRNVENYYFNTFTRFSKLFDYVQKQDLSVRDLFEMDRNEICEHFVLSGHIAEDAVDLVMKKLAKLKSVDDLKRKTYEPYIDPHCDAASHAMNHLECPYL